MSRLAGWWLHRAGAGVFHAGLHPVLMHADRRIPKVLTYHGIGVKNDFGSDSLTPAEFANHLEFLSDQYNIVSLETVLSGKYPDRSVVLTFDDGLRSVYEHAFPLLASAGLPASCFLVASVIGNVAMIWFHELSWLLHRHRVATLAILNRKFRIKCDEDPSLVLKRVIVAYDSERLEQVLMAVRCELGIDATTFARNARLYLTWEEIRAMAESGFSFGSHSLTHANLTRVAPAEQDRELAGSRALIADRLGTCSTFAYPFGAVNNSLRGLALSKGYTGLLEVGPCTAPPSRERLGRISVKSRRIPALVGELEILNRAKALLAASRR